MRGAASVVAAAFSVLAAEALAVVHPRCRHRHRRGTPLSSPRCPSLLPPPSLPTLLPTCCDIQSLLPRCPLLPHLACYCPRSCCCLVAPTLATVVAAVLPPPWPLLLSPLPPLLLCNPVLAAANTAIPRCRRRIAPALAALAVIPATAALPPLSLMLPSKLIFWLIVMFPQPLSLSPLVALSCCC